MQSQYLFTGSSTLQRMNKPAPFLRIYGRIAILNLLLVAAIGVLLRYKIAFSLPFIDQKHLLHAHSHFAFAGWITHVLLVMLVHYLGQQTDTEDAKKYFPIINANLITAYGMLISFPLQGYGLFSIIFSSLSIFVSYWFTIKYWRDLNRLPKILVTHWWMKAALLFNVISSIGAFTLAFMMATKTIQQNGYLAAIYFFLHFQYNGWFFFGCMGLASAAFLKNTSTAMQKKIFWLFAASCIPAYVLSALWLPLPPWSYGIVVAAAICQTIGWIFVLQQVKQQIQQIRLGIEPGILWIFLLVCIAASIKILLQLGSTIPALSTLAFGFRPIVIGYLHLILLGVISLFLIGYLYHTGTLQLKASALRAIRVFTAGIILNELLLMIQGIAAMTYFPVPYINGLLLLAACILFSGIFLLNFSQRSRT